MLRVFSADFRCDTFDQFAMLCFVELKWLFQYRHFINSALRNGSKQCFRGEWIILKEQRFSFLDTDVVLIKTELPTKQTHSSLKITSTEF